MNRYNVVIIGAGPAGSYLAYKLKNKGLDVLLLEKEIFPRYKSCAGRLSKKTYDILFSENKNVESIVEKELKKEIANLQTELKKKTEIDNFIMNSLGIIAEEMVHTKGIEAIKELFRKHNVPLAKD